MIASAAQAERLKFYPNSIYEFDFDKENCGVTISKQNDTANPIWVQDSTVL